MLGDLIAEETGKVTSFRVLDETGPEVEVSAHTNVGDPCLRVCL